MLRALLTQEPEDPVVRPPSGWNTLIGDTWILTAMITIIPVEPRCRITVLGVCLLADAVSEGRRCSCLKALLEAGAEPNELIQPRGPYYPTPLGICVCQHNVSLVRLLLSDGAEMPPAELSGGWDVLSLATIRGNADIIRALLDTGFENLSNQGTSRPEDHIFQDLVAPGFVFAAAAGRTTSLAWVETLRNQRVGKMWMKWS